MFLILLNPFLHCGLKWQVLWLHCSSRILWCWFQPSTPGLPSANPGRHSPWAGKHCRRKPSTANHKFYHPQVRIPQYCHDLPCCFIIAEAFNLRLQTSEDRYPQLHCQQTSLARKPELTGVQEGSRQKQFLSRWQRTSDWISQKNQDSLECEERWEKTCTHT